MKKIIAVVMLCVIVMMTVSCATDSTRIVGTWASQEKVLDTIITETRYTFNEDGTGSIHTVLGIELNMTYSLDEKNKALTVTTSTLGIESNDVYTYSFNGKNLILTKDGKEIVCTPYVEKENVETDESMPA